MLLDFKALSDVHIISQRDVGEATFSSWGGVVVQIGGLSFGQSFEA